MKLVSLTLYHNQFKVLADFLSYLFDTELLIENEAIKLNVSDIDFFVRESDCLNNHCQFKIEKEILEYMPNKIELFNYKSNSNFTLKNNSLYLNDTYIFSVI
ncbi:MAG: hypothetical protein N4A33_11500 [Bacteriovoracaceae bacterium]|jgi:hypothetical protein|nr:hypothetical protein [Bacteriovoracaceae bacterium]